MLVIVLLYLQQTSKSKDTRDVTGEREEAQEDCRKDNHSGKYEMSEILHDDINRFREGIHVYVPALKSALESDVNFLKEMALVGVKNSTKQSPPDRLNRPERKFSTERSATASKEDMNVSLVELISTRQTELRNMQEVLVPRANRKLISTTMALIEAHAELLETSLLLLSRGKHGTLSRAQKAQAELLKARAAEVDVQSQLKRAEVLSKIYTSDVRAALDRYHKHLLSIEDDSEMQKRKSLALLEEREL